MVPREIRPFGIIFFVGDDSVNLEKAKEEFIKYTKPYKDLNNACLLKVDHTFRVMDYCKEIAESLNLSEEDITLAMYSGLLHDIGRFEQWKKYQAFNDSISEDHAKLGVTILEKGNYLRAYLLDSSLDDILLKSIYYHNKYSIPEEFTEREKLFCNIIRDADKIDILYLRSIGEFDIDTNHESFSEKIYNDLLNEKTIRSEDIKTKGDNLSITLGFVFDINYSKSLEILKEKDYINQIINLYKEKNNNKEMKDQLEEIRKVVNNYIERRTIC